jgi:divalent metal cation (Fe/Co/Zn/Cd) transporter
MKSFFAGLVTVAIIVAAFTVVTNAIWSFQDHHPVIVGYVAIGIIIAGIALLLKGSRR